MVNNLQNKQEVQEIDLLKLLKVLWSKIWLIVLAAFVGGVAFFLYTFFFITPLYQSSALLYTALSLRAAPHWSRQDMRDSSLILMSS